MVQRGGKPPGDSISDRCGDPHRVALCFSSRTILLGADRDLALSVQFGFYYAQYDGSGIGAIFTAGRIRIRADRSDANAFWSDDFCRRQCYFGAEFYPGFDRYVDMFLDRIGPPLSSCAKESDAAD